MTYTDKNQKAQLGRQTLISPEEINTGTDGLGVMANFTQTTESVACRYGQIDPNAEDNCDSLFAWVSEGSKQKRMLQRHFSTQQYNPFEFLDYEERYTVTYRSATPSETGDDPNCEMFFGDATFVVKDGPLLPEQNYQAVVYDDDEVCLIAEDDDDEVSPVMETLFDDETCLDSLSDAARLAETVTSLSELADDVAEAEEPFPTPGEEDCNNKSEPSDVSVRVEDRRNLKCKFAPKPENHLPAAIL